MSRLGAETPSDRPKRRDFTATYLRNVDYVGVDCALSDQAVDGDWTLLAQPVAAVLSLQEMKCTPYTNTCWKVVSKMKTHPCWTAHPCRHLIGTASNVTAASRDPWGWHLSVGLRVEVGVVDEHRVGPHEVEALPAGTRRQQKRKDAAVLVEPVCSDTRRCPVSGQCAGF